MKRTGMAFLCLVLFLFAVFPVFPASAEPVTVRVACLNYPRYMMQQEDGSFTGFGIEYMEHLGEYGNFVCEFIPMTLQEANSRIAAGEIDLIPGHRRSVERDSMMLFSDLSMNIDSNVLCCRADDDRFAYEDFIGYDGITVGIMAGTTLGDSISKMEEHYGIHVRSEVFDNDESCHEALMNGQVDALMIGGFRLTEDMKILARLSASPLYIACTCSRPDLFAVINEAQSRLWAAEPFYSSSLLNQYYGDISESVSLSGAEHRYLMEHPTVKVGLLSSVPVFSDREDGTSYGALHDWFDRTYSGSGFAFEYRPVATVEDMLAGLQDGSLDIIFPLCVPTIDGASTDDLQLLEGRFPVTMVAVTKKNHTVTDILNESVVVSRNDRAFVSTLAVFMNQDHFKAVSDPVLAMDTVLNGEANIALMESAAALYLMGMPRYADMEIVPGFDSHVTFSPAVSPSADECLSSIMNKYTAELSPEAANNIILTASSRSTYKQTPMDFFYRYRVTISIIILLLALLISTLFFIILRQNSFRRREQEHAEALESARKAQQEAEAENTRLSIQQEADERIKQTLRLKAMHDELTGIYNMNGFKEAVRLILQNHPELEYMLVRLDLNRFSIFNDLFGMSAGNRLLCAIAQELDTRCNIDYDAYARLTGDHFVFCIPRDRMTENELSSVIHSWLRDYSPNYELQECIGIYYIQDRSMDVSIMCDRANLAQDSVKGIYPPRVGVYHEDLRDTVLEEQWITANMRSSLLNGEFLTYFQPQYRISTGELVGAELLSRWRAEERGLIQPDHFIPIFEKNGFITELDTYVWNRACKWLKDRMAAGLPTVPLAVNISRMDILNLDLAVFLPALVARYGLSPSLLHLEITESIFISQKDKMIETLCALRKAGFYIELDDFGTGYTSINVLRDLPIDMLKLDMSFMTGSDRFGRSSMITDAVVRLAGEIHMEVLAEGVETQEQIGFLSGMGCDLAQGYFYGAPMPDTRFEALLNGTK